jgi:ABC-2 type transport system ATP-binding protein
VWATVSHSRGLFGKPRNDTHIEKVLRDLALWDKKDNKIMQLSGGMKRRVLIAKALSHEPEILFLDEPTAGVDVELRRDMWRLIAALRDKGVTIILTTHYIEEAEEMADRVGVIDKGRLLLVDDKEAIMARLGRTEARFTLAAPLARVPDSLCAYPLHLEHDGRTLCYRGGDGTGKGKAEVAAVAQALTREGIAFTALDQRESSLEDIFVGLVEREEQAA